MLSIPREVTEHALCLIPGLKPTKQRLCHFDDERRRAIGKEISKLLVAGFIREVFHSDWLALLVPFLLKRRPRNGECVLIILASTKRVQRITFLCHA